eukprot:CAMPEP_0178747156 /NCGR_PEP_ID=MMETSP0744-20121128/8173_1 /TAXON_ID=913974 /ORGANISM="Nitzschia punctata, Strain CCMP561" /LENGTH=88 /DNA_ID=CAMNT_0020400377 /DNA_START=1 /DNA_END=267 /DNA_ORIENTATION=+
MNSDPIKDMKDCLNAWFHGRRNTDYGVGWYNVYIAHNLFVFDVDFVLDDQDNGRNIRQHLPLATIFKKVCNCDEAKKVLAKGNHHRLY